MNIRLRKSASSSLVPALALSIELTSDAVYLLLGHGGIIPISTCLVDITDNLLLM